MITVNEFYDLANLKEDNEVEKSIKFIWYLKILNEACTPSANDITQLFNQCELPQPNKSRLEKKLQKEKKLIKVNKGGAILFNLHRETAKKLDSEYYGLIQVNEAKPLKPLATSLEKIALELKAEQTKKFVLEAVGCLNSNYLRAAIVLSWQGAFAIIIDHEFNHNLDAFNEAALSRQIIKKRVTKIEHFQKIQESDILLCLESSGTISKSVKLELNSCLTKRNNCGHPNDFQIGEAQVAGHIEVLIKHIFLQYA